MPGNVATFVAWAEFENPLIDQTSDYTLIDASLAWTAANEKLKIGFVGEFA